MSSATGYFGKSMRRWTRTPMTSTPSAAEEGIRHEAPREQPDTSRRPHGARPVRRGQIALAGPAGRAPRQVLEAGGRSPETGADRGPGAETRAELRQE